MFASLAWRGRFVGGRGPGRSGIGELTLVDLDDVCISNVNRQLHALDGELGKPKVEVLARRVRPSTPTASRIQSKHSSSNPMPAKSSSRATIMCSMPSTARPKVPAHRAVPRKLHTGDYHRGIRRSA